MKQESKSIIENLLVSIEGSGNADIERIKRDLNSVLFIESVSSSKKFDMYSYCDKKSIIVYHHGVFHDPKDKLAVVTDGHIICYSKEMYLPDYAGKVIDKCGNDIKCAFPNWRYVTNRLSNSSSNYHFRKLDLTAIDDAAKRTKVWASVNLRHISDAKSKEGKMLFNIDGSYFSIDNIRKASLALREFGFKGINVLNDPSEEQAAFYIEDDKGIAVMPMRIDNYENKKDFYVVKL